MYCNNERSKRKFNRNKVCIVVKSVFLKDSESLPIWRVHSITKDRIHEKNVVQNFFGEATSEVRRDIGLDEQVMEVFI